MLFGMAIDEAYEPKKKYDPRWVARLLLLIYFFPHKDKLLIDSFQATINYFEADQSIRSLI